MARTQEAFSRDTVSPEAETLVRTLAGTLVGTVPYMSTEQVKGEPVDIRSDIFSLGCVLYEMLTGKSPFQRNTNAETIAAILSEDPPEISGIAKDVPVALARITHRCMAKDPDLRFQSANDLSSALKSIARTETIKASPALQPAGIPLSLRNPRIWIVPVLIMAAFAFWFSRKGQESPMPPSKIQSIAVLPLANLSGNPQQEYFAEGMTEAVIAHLAQIRALKVISRTSVMQYKKTRKPVREIGKELQVDAVIEGSVLYSGNRVRITAQLIDARSDAHLWAQTYDRDIQDVLSLQSEIASDIAQQIRIEISPEERKSLATKTKLDPQGYEAYLKGRYFWNKRSPEGMKKSLEYFQEVLDLDPTYAPAYVGIADCYIAHGGALLGIPGKEAYAKAKAAITKALEIDEKLAEAHASLGSIKGELEHDWNGAEKEYRRAIELKPGYATAHHWYSDFLVIHGRLEEALKEIERALEIDPLSLIINTSVAIKLYTLGRDDEAIHQLQRTLEMDPNFILAHIFLGRTYLQKGMNEDALKSFLKSGARGYIGYGYAVTGKQDEAKRILRQLGEQSLQEYTNPYDFALLHLGLGEKEEALEWLEKAQQDNVEEILFLKVEPLVAPVRSDPRFTELLRRLNL